MISPKLANFTGLKLTNVLMKTPLNVKQGNISNFIENYAALHHKFLLIGITSSIQFFFLDNSIPLNSVLRYIGEVDSAHSTVLILINCLYNPHCISSDTSYINPILKVFGLDEALEQKFVSTNKSTCVLQGFLFFVAENMSKTFPIKWINK